MPLYDFKCKKCKTIFLELVSTSDCQADCPKCGLTATEKMFSAGVGYIIKGNNNASTSKRRKRR